MAHLFFVNRAKEDAIDVFIEGYNYMPDNPRHNITSDVSEKIIVCNEKIRSLEKEVELQ